MCLSMGPLHRQLRFRPGMWPWTLAFSFSPLSLFAGLQSLAFAAQDSKFLVFSPHLYSSSPLLTSSFFPFSHRLLVFRLCTSSLFLCSGFRFDYGLAS